ncbi:MAG: BatD family protein [Proteobacteria bacterium]|nr:BatD family protein [Pseudomonadota bacterium]MBU1639747.1 BatD family protein [Pseudomonadota bacterium]
MSSQYITMSRHLFSKLTIALFALLLLPAPGQATDEITVQAQVASREVYVGQPFTLQLEINGAEAAEQPTINLQDFRVEPQGGTNRSQSYQISINGKVQTTKTLSYTYQYLLTATKVGTLTIPAFPVVIKGVTYRTTPIAMTVKEPEEIDEFKLHIELSKTQCYLGEPITMTTTWLIGQDLQGFEFNLPLFNDPRFELYTQTPSPASGRKELVEIEVAGDKVIAQKQATTHNGRDYISLSFRHTLVPRSPGKIKLPAASLAINAFDGYSQSRGRQFGTDPFDMFGSGRRKMYRTVVIPANQLGIEVLALPSQGRPPHFSGLVGKYTILTEASPTTVNVGDPISLTVSIGGTFVDNLSLPPLEAALPGRDFKIATEKPQSTVNGGIKSFTTTIRASHDQVNKIPGLSLPFFNTDTKKYEVARSAEINLVVNPTRVVTAEDALGSGEKNSGNGPSQTAISNEATQDIRANYVEINSAPPEQESNLLFIAILLLPPLLFGLLFFIDYYQHDDSRESRHRRRQAYRRLRKKLHSCGQDEFFEAWLEFLGDKLGRPGRAITRDDVLIALADHPDDPEMKREVEKIFTLGEAALYGGLGHVLEKDTLLRVAKNIAKVL